jgi:pimeloyl-ACP methyl ester carboxylesterase
MDPTTRSSAQTTTLEQSAQELEHKLVQTPYGQIEYYQMGKGSPVFLFSGYLTDVSSWDKEFVARLASHHTVYLVHYRNVGRSMVIEDDAQTLKDYATDIYHMCTKLNIKKATLIGHSMGGIVAQQLAKDYPSLVARMVLINTMPPGDEGELPPKDILQHALDIPESLLPRFRQSLKLCFPPQDKAAMFSRLVNLRFLPPDLEQIKFVPNKKIQQNLMFTWSSDKTDPTPFLKVEVPTLILVSDKDIVILPQNSNLIARIYKNHQMKTYQDAGHLLFFQFPYQIADDINEFIDLSQSN